MDNSKKKGRPKSTEARIYGKPIRLTQTENKILDERFENGDYKNFSDMVRDILIYNQYKIITLNVDERIQRNILIEEVRRIGNNFNQLIKNFNQKKTDAFTREEVDILLFQVGEIKDIFIKIENNISSKSKE